VLSSVGGTVPQFAINVRADSLSVFTHLHGKSDVVTGAVDNSASICDSCLPKAADKSYKAEFCSGV
jgi:hypothetical protein